MKLIQFTASNGWRGHEQKIIYLYEAFEKYAYTTNQWIMCPVDSEVYRVAKSKNMQVIPYVYKSEYDLKLAKRLKSICIEKAIDVVLIHSSKAHTIAVLSTFIYRLKTPLSLCRTLIKRVDTNFFRKWKYNYKGIQKIICVSQPVVESLKPAVNPKNHEKFTVIGSVTDVEKFKKQHSTGLLHRTYNIPKDMKIIGNIAEFTGFKDHYTWVDTVKILVERGQINAKYLLVGKGSMEDDIKAYVTKKGLSEHIIFTGFRTDIPEILPEFDAFMFTSKSEPTGGVLLEAYACKVPIVAANAGGIPEVIINGKTGLLAEVCNPIDFADKLEYLLENEKLQKELTKNGYQHLLDNFTKEKISKRFYDELQATIQQA